LFRRLLFPGFAVDAGAGEGGPDGQVEVELVSQAGGDVGVGQAGLAGAVTRPRLRGDAGHRPGLSHRCRSSASAQWAGRRDRLLDVGNLPDQRPEVELLLDQAGPLVQLRRVLLRSLAGAAGEPLKTVELSQARARAMIH
jgi:hypothetical protein